CSPATEGAAGISELSNFLEFSPYSLVTLQRLLQLNHPPPSQNQNQPSQNWAESLGALLGAVVQIIFYMDAEIRNREEARAREAIEFEESEGWVLATGKNVKKEPGLVAEVGSALKIESPNNWNQVENQDDPPKPLVRKTGAKTRSRRKKQRKNLKQEPVPWKKPKGNHSSGAACLEDPEAGNAEGMEISESTKSNQKPCVKQEEVALKKPMAKCAWKAPRTPPQEAAAEAKSLGRACESDQDGGQESTRKKKAVGWASGKNPAPMRKKKKVSLGPVSYVLVNSEDAKKKPVIPKKGPGSRRDASVQKASRSSRPTESPASTSRGPKSKSEGSPLEDTNESRKL
uniref:Paraneoplastic antigen-like protein 8A C-terminal domain-containing protein n=1 Tax=Otolemur garnettii TaxID=30611 RepID=H0XPQ8_OTOGA